MKETIKRIEWHPAFQATIQIEFENESDKLIFESEHLLSKKPMQIDELIIKVKDHEVIEKNIGKIFRKYNIIEYKSPDDHLTTNDFYKVYAYCCFYQSDTETVLEISPQELTITFICNHYPRKMMQHLQKYRNLKIVKIDSGIYYITGDEFPIQLLITKELDPAENLWLQSLRKDIKYKKEIEFLLKVYDTKKYSKLHQAAMDVITRANWESMMEVKDNMVCDALRELFADELQDMKEKVREEVTEKVTEEVTEKVTEEITEKVTEEITEKVTEEVTEKVTEEVTEKITVQMIKNIYESIKDLNTIAQILKIPLETVEKSLQI